MQLLVAFAAVLSASEGRHYFPYQGYRPQDGNGVATAAPPPYPHRSVNDVTVVDEKTGIQYNPYSKHHPGRHVCTNHRNVTYPVRTKRVFCKPTYKKYTVRCGDQWCEGVRLVYEKYHKEMVDTSNRTVVDYKCCPGWTQVNYWSHGCNKPVCNRPCLNGGRCVKPDHCSCPPEYHGTYCENKVSVFRTDLPCVPTCQNGGTCNPDKSSCICLPGYQGDYCERDIDECKAYKPCDQFCYNTPGSYKCECKENFALQKDGQSCRKEHDDGSTLEARDLEQMRLDIMDRQLQKLEKMVRDKNRNEVSRKDIDTIYNHIDKIGSDIHNISSKLELLESIAKNLGNLWSNVRLTEKKKKCKDISIKRFETQKAPCGHCINLRKEVAPKKSQSCTALGSDTRVGKKPAPCMSASSIQIANHQNFSSPCVERSTEVVVPRNCMQKAPGSTQKNTSQINVQPFKCPGNKSANDQAMKRVSLSSTGCQSREQETQMPECPLSVKQSRQCRAQQVQIQQKETPESPCYAQNYSRVETQQNQDSCGKETPESPCYAQNYSRVETQQNQASCGKEAPESPCYAQNYNRVETQQNQASCGQFNPKQEYPCHYTTSQKETPYRAQNYNNQFETRQSSCNPRYSDDVYSQRNQENERPYRCDPQCYDDFEKQQNRENDQCGYQYYDEQNQTDECPDPCNPQKYNGTRQKQVDRHSGVRASPNKHQTQKTQTKSECCSCTTEQKQTKSRPSSATRTYSRSPSKTGPKIVSPSVANSQLTKTRQNRSRSPSPRPNQKKIENKCSSTCSSQPLLKSKSSRSNEAPAAGTTKGDPSQSKFRMGLRFLSRNGSKRKS